MTITFKPNPKKKSASELLNETVRKSSKSGHVDKKTLKKASEAIQKRKREMGNEFIHLLRENAHKTDDELMAELAPYLVKSATTAGGRRGGAVGGHVQEKTLLAFRLRQRGLTYEQIGEQMSVSGQQVYLYIAKAKELLRVDPASIDIPQNVGETLNFYEDVKAMSLMIASMGTSTASVKLNAMRVALDCERDRNEFLTKVGVYSAPVMLHFQQLMLNQFVVPSQDAKEQGMEAFFSGLAQDLMQASAADKLQSIAMRDVQDVEPHNA
jgi:hypothetical protein